MDPVRWPTRVRCGILLANRGIAGLLGILFAFEPVADVSNRQLITGLQTAGLDPHAIDPDAIGAAKVADHDLVMVAGHAAVMSRNPQRFQPGVASRTTAHDDHGAIQSDVWAFIESDESCGH